MKVWRFNPRLDVCKQLQLPYFWPQSRRRRRHAVARLRHGTATYNIHKYLYIEACGKGFSASTMLRPTSLWPGRGCSCVVVGRIGVDGRNTFALGDHVACLAATLARPPRLLDFYMNEHVPNLLAEDLQSRRHAGVRD
jgi:hypothetical protein